MRKSRYSEEQITNAIKASETGVKVREICEELGISEATFYSWKKKFSGLSSEEGRKIKELEDQLLNLTRELQSLSSDKEMLQSVLKNFFTTNEKRQAVNFLQTTFDIGTRRSCRLLDISRSVYHYPAGTDNR
ncbi:IS3 family transposase [Pantoea sp. BIGb0393]|jgi:putative transposase|uniref:IS3 family transposase n=6 Tax=Pantoea TaxID=53335 RepID=A0ABU8PUY9_9GAMM|nr:MULTISPECIES: IS3 family transposase [Enterobacterales]MDY0928492.1 IS3 family transposase [Enterobacter sp. CFBP8995]MRS21845.1 IS3 family transposase [Enterobacteriaceae bacterium RIT692]MRT25184.1 IS3 family transposase [Enterobacteriaceae bacterium RIT697]MRT41184.1 IS3 family transposase [Enterobacteriaceae bacterium RIT702]EJL86143.1 Transposase [Pantoea sp. GM01]